MRRFLCICIGLFCLQRIAGGQSAQLDPTFHHNGFIITDSGKGPDEAVSIAPLPGGKFLVGGTAWNGNPDFALARFQADGTPDLTFGASGRVFIDMNGFDRLAFIHALPDGKVLLAGSSGLSDGGLTTAADFALARCLPDGRLDPDFGDKGRVRVANGFTGNNLATAAAVQPDGKILLTGTITEPYLFDSKDIAILRFTPEGAPDTTFGAGGMVVLDPGPGKNRAGGIALQAGGKIVIAGVRDTLSGDILLAQFHPDGQLDTSFGEGGLVRTNLYAPNDSFPFPSGDAASSIIVRPDSMIVVVGDSYHAANVRHLVAVQYFPDGTLNSVMPAVPGGFGTPGYVDTYEEGLAAALQPDGKIVAAGNFYTQNSDLVWKPNFFLVRFLPDGPTDDQFDENGLKIIDINDYDRARAVAVLPDGKILAAGQTYDASDPFNDIATSSDIAMIRLDTSGAFDTTFAHTGIAVLPVGTNSDRGTDVLLQADGNILVGAVIDTVLPYTPPVKPADPATGQGYSHQNVPDYTVIRYLSDGAPDTGFGSKGRSGFTANEPNPYYTNDYSMLYNSPYAPAKTALAQRPNGNILVVGSREFDFGVAEFYPDGSQDSVFLLAQGDSLILPIVRRIDFSYGIDVATSIVLDEMPGSFYPNVGFTVAGYSGDAVAVAWCCYVPNLGNAYRKGVIDIGPSFDYATAVGYQTDTALNLKYTLIGGYFLDGFGGLPRFFLARLQQADTYQYAPDPGFGEAGIVRGFLGDSTDCIHAFAIQPDNGIIAAGAVDDKMAAFRFLPDGMPDSGFGNNGVTILPFGLAAHDIAIQPDGKIVLTGRSSDQIITARLLPTGAPDPAWGDNGVLRTKLRGKKDMGSAVTVQDDGKIVVAGASDDPFAGTDVALLRYLPNSILPPLVVSTTVQAVLCAGDTSGMAAVSASSGVPPYTYSWNTGAGTAVLSNIPAGTYSVTVTDSEFQQRVISISVPEPEQLEIDVEIESEAACNGQSGILAASPAGGTPPYALGWSSGAVGTVASYPAGNYSLTLTDANGCSVESAGVMSEAPDTEAPALDCQPVFITMACSGPVDYPAPEAIDNCQVASLTLVSGLPPGSVFPEGSTLVMYQASDAAGNTATCSIDVQVLNTLTVSGSVTPAWINASNGAVTATVDGGTPPYAYAWTRDGIPVGSETALTGIPAGTYTLEATDSEGCTIMTTWIVPEVVASGEPGNVLQCLVFPNPFWDKIRLQLDLQHAADIRWSVCDFTGRCFLQQDAGTTDRLRTTLSTGSLPPGIYLLQIRIDTGMVQLKLVHAR